MVTARTTQRTRPPVEVIVTRAVDDVEFVDQRRSVPWGWVHSRAPDGGWHVTPTYDVQAHWYDDQCLCGPVLDEAEQMIHNSFDGRERYEQGRARPN